VGYRALVGKWCDRRGSLNEAADQTGAADNENGLSTGDRRNRCQDGEGTSLPSCPTESGARLTTGSRTGGEKVEDFSFTLRQAWKWWRGRGRSVREVADHPWPHRTYPLDRIVGAYRYIEIGNVVITIPSADHRVDLWSTTVR
jgi:hypothetical protein